MTYPRTMTPDSVKGKREIDTGYVPQTTAQACLGYTKVAQPSNTTSGWPQFSLRQIAAYHQICEPLSVLIDHYTWPHAVFGSKCLQYLHSYVICFLFMLQSVCNGCNMHESDVAF